MTTEVEASDGEGEGDCNRNTFHAEGWYFCKNVSFLLEGCTNTFSTKKKRVSHSIISILLNELQCNRFLGIARFKNWSLSSKAMNFHHCT